jgi:membrane protease YdiL (CAAX protease family)
VATNANAGAQLVESLRRNAFFRLGAMAACLMVWLVGFVGFAMPALKTFGASGTLVGDGVRILGALVYVAGAIFLYRLLVRWIERRAVVELSRKPGAALGFLGFANGTLLFCGVISLLWVIGAAQLAGFGDTTHLVGSFAAAMMAAVGEELLFRGVLFRILEQAAGTLTALLVSALLFGLAHIINPNATLFSSLAIAIEAGLLLGLAFVVTRNLWFPIGIHLAWNFTQGGIFGASVSGFASHGLVKTAFLGPDSLTGGAFGPEASVVSLALCLALAAAFAMVGLKRGEWRPARLKLTLE